MTAYKSAFFAYPASPDAVGATIEKAIRLLTSRNGNTNVASWRELDIAGHFIATEVLNQISATEVLFADITYLNFNVLFEIGYAIGLSKRIVLTKNKSLAGSEDASELGIIDTIGYRTYQNADELQALMHSIDDLQPIPIPQTKNRRAPIYLNQGKHRTDQESQIISRVKKARLYFRSFDPNESPRLNATEAIKQVVQSYGVLVHFVPNEVAEAKLHNLRAAFIAGLAYAFEDITTTFIQSGETPVPIDYRDLVTVCRHPDEFVEAVAEFSANVTERLQASDAPIKVKGGTLLEALNLGASSAENELADLAEYYLETDAFRRAHRKEVRIVTGRKGSGKTAIFFRLRDTTRNKRGNIVLDLKPEGYQLLKFKDTVLSLMATGTVEHTLTAFWEYLLLLEVCYKLLEKDQDLHKRDHRIFEPYQRLRALYETDRYTTTGDFAERMSYLLRDISAEYESQFGGTGHTALSVPQITDLLYRHDVGRLRREVQEYLQFKEELWLLFDNIDKGWPTKGVKSEDLVIIRTLIEATRKIERELSSKGVGTHTVVFLRNDVFELLIDATPDRGKETRATVDWNDPDLLRELLRRRVTYSQNLPEDKTFEELWRQICTPVVFGEESSQFLIDRSLMRPRNLIDLVNHCRSYAVNLRHSKIEESDVEKGLDSFSTDLVAEIGLEIRDVFPDVSDLLFAFVGSSVSLRPDEVRLKLKESGVTDDQMEHVIDILMWFGFLGVQKNSDEPRFIYSFNYQLKLMQAHLRAGSSNGLMLSINPAFWSGLDINLQH